MESLRLVSTAVPELLGGPKIRKVGQVPWAMPDLDHFFIS